MTTIAEDCVPFLRQCLYVERPFLFTILPNRSLLLTTTPTDRNLCCSLAISPSPH